MESSHKICGVAADRHNATLASVLGLCARYARIYQFGTSGIKEVSYRDTEHFKVTHDFLANPERMMRVLFEQPT
jgi:predicted ATPase